MAVAYATTLVVISSLLLIFLSPAKGDLRLVQVKRSTGQNWTVEGLASYDYGGCCAIVFDFICYSSNPDPFIAWSRVTGGTLTKIQVGVNGFTGTMLRFDTPLAADAGIYRCTDTSVTPNEFMDLNITSISPVVQAINNPITVVQGDPITIGFYVAQLGPVHPNNITWQHNGKPLNSGNFDSTKKKLNISAVTQADSGMYRLVVAAPLMSFVVGTVNVTVLVPPTVISHPSNNSGIQEWSSFQLSCTVHADRPFIVYWTKLGGNLPSNYTITNSSTGNSVTSNLTVNNVRVSDSGQYRCYSTFTDGTHPAYSNYAHISIQGALRILFTPSGSLPSFPLSPLLFTGPSTSYSVECQGTGSLEWMDMGGALVTMDTNNVPYQETTSGSFQRLVFSTYSEGRYSCVSDQGVSKDIYVTNDNPAIFSPNSTHQVGNITTTSLLVYVGGDPSPFPSNITWYFNNEPIMSFNGHYQLTEDNTRLLINAPSSDVTGEYRVTVATSEGSQSVLLNVTYFDPPVISLTPSLSTVNLHIGDSYSLYCNVTSPLETSLSWNYNGREELPMGVVLSQGGVTMTISSAVPEQAGLYECVASDGLTVVREGVNINVIYGPSVQLDTPSNPIIIQEGTVSNGVTCTGRGYPSPQLSWSFNGSNGLPSGISTVSSSNGDTLHLVWSRPVVYSDEGTYYCTVSNTFNSTTASISISVNATPMIYSIYPSQPTPVDTTPTTTTPTFNCPENSSTQCSVVCVARGWPAPSLYWIDSSGRSTNSYVIRERGVVLASLNWNKTSSLQYRCEARNQYGSTTQPVNLVSLETTPPATPPLPSLPTGAQNDVRIRLRLLTPDCRSQSDHSLRREDLRISLTQVLVSQCQYCSPDTIITVPLSNCDNTSTALVQSTVFIVAIDSPTLSDVYNTLAQWWISSPTISVGSLYHIDTSCLFNVEQGSSENQLSCIPPIPSISSTVTPSPTATQGGTSAGLNTLEVLWAVVVGVIVVLCLIVGCTLMIVLILCVRSFRGQKGGKDIGSDFNTSMATLRTYHSNPRSSFASTSIEMESPFNATNSLEVSEKGGGERGGQFSTSSESLMFDNPEYMQNQLIEEVRRSTLERDSAQNFNHNRTNMRVLQTTPTDEIDAPPTLSQRHHSVGGVEVTVRNTPIQEILYQETTPTNTPTSTQEENVYDKIRTTAKRTGSPPYVDPPDFPGRHVSTLPRSPPSSPQYTEPTPPLRQKGLSTPSLAGGPLPYSLPVSSQKDIHKIPPQQTTTNYNSNSLKLLRTISVPTNNHIHAHSRVGGGSRGHLPAVREDGHAHRPWWYGNADITTPTQTDYGYSSAASSRVGMMTTPLSREGSDTLVGSPMGSGTLVASPVSRQGSGSVIVTPISPGVTMYEV